MIEKRRYNGYLVATSEDFTDLPVTVTVDEEDEIVDITGPLGEHFKMVGKVIRGVDENGNIFHKLDYVWMADDILYHHYHDVIYGESIERNKNTDNFVRVEIDLKGREKK